MELRHLRYFAVIADELSFRRAAERLHISHPALSKQIKDLERELGVMLVERNTVRTRLTPAGEVFQDEVRNILEDVDRACQRVRALAETGKRLSIGHPGPFAISFMAEVLKGFHTEHPEVDVALVNLTPPKQVPALLAGDIKVAICLPRDIPSSPDLEKGIIVRSRLGVAVGSLHRLASQRTLSPAQLTQEKVLCLPGPIRSPHHSDIRMIYAAVGERHPPLHKIDSFETLQTMISGEQGITFLPMIFAHSCSKDVKVIPLVASCDDVVFELWAIWRKRERSPLVRDFVATLRSRKREF